MVLESAIEFNEIHCELIYIANNMLNQRSVGDLFSRKAKNRYYHGLPMATTTTRGGLHDQAVATQPFKACLGFWAVGITGSPWFFPWPVVTRFAFVWSKRCQLLYPFIFIPTYPI